MRDRLAALVASRRWEWTITALILVNAVTLGLETSATAMAAAGPVLMAIDAAILSVFAVEIATRLYVHRLRFFADPWSVFDVLVVGVALMSAAGELSVLRALRVLRVLRLVSVMPSLRRVVSGLIAALPGMGSIVLLMAIRLYVFSVMATELFGDRFPEWFGTLGASAYTLFQIMTLESWSMGIVRPVMEVYPWAWALFVPFILSTAFTVLNLFIGVIVSAMSEDLEAAATQQREALHDEQAALADEIRALRRDVAELKTALARAPAQ